MKKKLKKQSVTLNVGPQHVLCGVRGCADACVYAQAALDLPGVYSSTMNKRSLTIRNAKGKTIGEFSIPVVAREAIDTFDRENPWPVEAYGAITFGPLAPSQTRAAIKKRAKAIREGKVVVKHGSRHYKDTGRNTGSTRATDAVLLGRARQTKAQEALEQKIANKV